MGYKIDALLKKWQKRNIAGLYCDTKKQAADKMLEIIPVSASLGFSGSETLEQIGILRRLQARGNTVYNPYKIGLSRKESMALRKKGTQADYYLASANAITEKGELIFFSAYGNRTAGIAYAKNVIIVCGINKLTLNINKAFKRAREHSATLNCERLNWDSACVKDGVCREKICLFPENKRMCCQILIIEAEVAPERLKVILVGENLGF